MTAPDEGQVAPRSGTAGDAAAKRIFLPFDLPVFEYINSNHPLLVGLTERQYDEFKFVRPSLSATPNSSVPSVLRQAACFAEELTAKLPALPPNDSALAKFIAARDFASQARMDLSTDLAFFHTAPMHLNQMPYLLHIESITTLFHPMLVQGYTQNIELKNEHVYWFARAMLESPQCRGIFTNLQHTKSQVDRVLNSDIISRKTRHVPAGPYFSPDEARKVEAAWARKRDKQEIEILFTNSWHQRSPNFFLRGGLDLVMAFLYIERNFPNVRLILRTAWPPEIENTDVTKVVRQHPKITLLPDKLTDDEIFDLFLRADIFFLDAASVHSISLLRAMYCGAACIVSDAPGYEEYATHGESAIVVPGRRADVYSEDPSTGWLRDDFKPMFSPTAERIGLVAGVLNSLCANREARLKLGANARTGTSTRNSFAGWQRGFEAALRDALAGAG